MSDFFTTAESKLTLSTDEAKNYLGGKGAGLYWMASEGVNVPPFMIIPTTMYTEYKQKPKGTMKAIKSQLPVIKAYFKEKFGYMPLLSVRSGARVSCPGMMDTILNVGLDDQSYMFWADKLGEQCAKDCMHRLSEMYGSVVLGKNKDFCSSQDVPDTDMQILNSIEAVFKSWDNERAVYYRKLNSIPGEWGTAVTLQAMVFGNLNENSGTGVLFTRNPDTGADVITGEYLMNAQGEDVVAGTSTPLPLDQMAFVNPAALDELCLVVKKLETLKKDVQDVEFTIQDGTLYILQTRNAKRSATAAVQIAMDMYLSEMLTLEEALAMVTSKQFDICQMPVLNPKFKEAPKFTGIPACSGVVTGVVMLSSKAAINCKVPCILVTQETTPDDIQGMHSAAAVLTMTGGATSHAAVVARSMNKPCVVGLSVQITEFNQGDTISIDGATGRVWMTPVPVIDGSDSLALKRFKNLLVLKTGAYLINGQTEGAVGLISMASMYCLPLEKQLEAVAVAAEKYSKVYVDLRVNFDEDESAFFGPFLGASLYLEVALLNRIEESFIGPFPEGKVQPDIVLITKLDTKLNSVKAIDSLGELIQAEGEVVVSLPSDDEIHLTKLLSLKGDSVQSIAIGSIQNTGKFFATESQLVSYLLK
jgi:phosphoenolpyruvate synthase/pyruvate phosphate dikinase